MRSEDIARLAGVSRSTVSRVINNYPNVPEKTRIKVMKIIEQYHYEPNISARVLAGKGTNTIGLFVVSFADKTNVNRIYQNGYFAPFVDALVDTVNAMGYYVLIHTVYSEADYFKIKQAFQQKRIDGCVIVGTQGNVESLRDIVDLEVPLVLVDCDPAELAAHRLDRSTMAVVNSGDYEGTEAAVRYLHGLGHRKIGMINGRLNTYSGRQRNKAYLDTLQSCGLETDPSFILNGGFIRETAYSEVRKLLAGGTWPTAFLSANDEMALGAQEALKEHGLQVPADISLIGFDDTPAASQITPALTSVRLPIYEMSRTAAETVVNLCEKESAGFASFAFLSHLIERESCRGL